MDSNNNLLNFVNIASSNIQEALTKPPKKKRNVNIRKFTATRVKRLVDSKKPRTGTTSTKSKLAQLKPSSARVPAHIPVKQSYTWPEFKPSRTPSIQSLGISTESIDPELESLLSELESPSFSLSRHGSFDSVHTGPSLSTPSCNTLETRVCLGEQAFSPYSDEHSEDLDSAYCSPVESARVSYNCSPTNFTTSVPDWTVPMTSTSPDWLPPMTSTCLQSMGVISTGCGSCMSQDPAPLTFTSCVASSSIYDQGPPMTPTFSQILEQYYQ